MRITLRLKGAICKISPVFEGISKNIGSKSPEQSPHAVTIMSGLVTLH